MGKSWTINFLLGDVFMAILDVGATIGFITVLWVDFYSSHYPVPNEGVLMSCFLMRGFATPRHRVTVSQTLSL